MARALRIGFAGAIYHVSSRMVGSWRDRGDRLFRDKKDHERFRQRLAEGVKEAGIGLYLFCQMSNHFHLVLETPQANLSRFMQSLTTAYTVYYNQRHERHGHVLDGRFKAKLVSGDEYLLRLSRYVHQNPAWVSGWAKRPLRERIAHLHGYAWSSYPSYIGLSKPLDFVDYGPVMKLIKQLSGQGRSGYKRYVDTGLAEIDGDFEEALKASPCCIGEEGFRLWVERLRGVGLKKRKILEDLTFRRTFGAGGGVEGSGQSVRSRSEQLPAAASQLGVASGGSQVFDPADKPNEKPRSG